MKDPPVSFAVLVQGWGCSQTYLLASSSATDDFEVPSECFATWDFDVAFP